jgi:GAF domain-containing protein
LPRPSINLKARLSAPLTNIQNTFETLTVEKKRLEEELVERGSELETQTSRLRTSASTARAIAEVESINDLLDTTTRLIAERFEYQHVGLYILNEQKNIAFLQSASSDAGRKMIGQGFQMGFDKRNPFKLVAETNRPLILLDGDPSKFVKDENFPLTRSRMILPLTLRGSVIGFLDIQSDQPRAFTVLDTDPLQILADLATLSFDNARLVNETRSLILQLDANMAVQTQRSWAKFTERIKPAYQYTPAGIRPLFSHEKRSDGTGLNIPLILHGQKIGMINLKRKGNEKWSKRERALVEKIAEQVTLALENSRLVDEAQKSAMRDQMIANISTSIRETLDVNAVIRTAATELRKVFDLKEAEIIVGSPYQNRDRQ